MILGMDFSSLEETEKKGAIFRVDGKQVDLVECLADHGITSARLRLWNAPYAEDGAPYEGGTCDIGVLERTALRAKRAGMDILLDFHYSDFWCDPARQLVPKAWRGKNVEELAKAVGNYTVEVLDRLHRIGIDPAAVQVGNEITNGMLWPYARLSDDSPRKGYDELACILREGTAAVRENSDAKVLLHLERSGAADIWKEWFDNIIEREVKFDVIGASYYPYWHGTMQQMRDNLNSCAQRYGKDIWVVETSYPFTTEHYNPDLNTASLCIASGCCEDGRPSPYELSAQGQAQYIGDLLNLVENLDDNRGKAVYWWEPGWIPANGTSWASRASLAYAGEEEKSTGNEWSNQCLFDYEGNALPALNVFKDYAK